MGFKSKRLITFKGSVISPGFPYPSLREIQDDKGS
jgi:hypothetical protein